jgi:hypothetical protein
MQQYHYGAIHPFLPDPMYHPSRPAKESWRPSEAGIFPKGRRDTAERPFDIEPTYQGHPWLLLSNSTYDSIQLLRTPMADWADHRTDNIAFGPGWSSWGVGAQQAYSLLYNIELNQMHRYHFGRAIDFEPTTRNENSRHYEGPGGERLLDMNYHRYNLNFVAIWGHDVRQALPIDDDELEITCSIPRLLKRPFVIDTRAVVGHFSFFIQRDKICQTDLLDRYRALANEIACDATNLKKPFAPRCRGF